MEQLKDDFTHNVTHELKTPIAITYAAIEAMIHYNITGNKEKTNKYLHICHEEVLRSRQYGRSKFFHSAWNVKRISNLNTKE